MTCFGIWVGTLVFLSAALKIYERGLRKRILRVLLRHDGTAMTGYAIMASAPSEFISLLESPGRFLQRMATDGLLERTEQELQKPEEGSYARFTYRLTVEGREAARRLVR